jgi:Methyltransferase domain
VKAVIRLMCSEAMIVRLQKLWRAFRRRRIRFYHRFANFFSLNFAKKEDYYSVLPVLEHLYLNRKRWEKPSRLTGLEYNVAEMRELFTELLEKHADRMAETKSYEEIARAGYGPGYPRLDAIVSYCMLRKFKPARYLEVGSGLSTYVAWLAGQKNAEEGFPIHIKCIEPYPSKQLQQIKGIELIQDEVQDVPLSDFDFIQAGDVLFVDSTHALKIDSDVAYLMMEVVPNVAPGAWIHIHDIPFPFNTPFPADTWILGDRRPVFWQEAMVLQAFLAFNNRFKIKMSVPLIRYHNEEFLAGEVKDYVSLDNDYNPPSAIWLKQDISPFP